MTLFMCLVYVGGVAALDGQKLGFFSRALWPLTLGRALHEWAIERTGPWAKTDKGGAE